MVHGPTSEKEMKNKELEEAKKKAEDDYQGGGAYRAFLELFYKNKMNRQTAKIFRIKCIAKKCRETGKWDLLSRLCYKYSWINLTAGEADYD
jgi:hypothetical protein